ncbi:MAG: aminodeoxychorismate synthase component I [bacterium]|nr:aminodeoxychorismate synthase component I [bacterium]
MFLEVFPLDLLHDLEQSGDDFILLECCRAGVDDNASFLFRDAVEVISCHELLQVEAALARAEEALSQGYWLAGYLAYEAGYAFERIEGASLPNMPLIRLGVYDSPAGYCYPVAGADKAPVERIAGIEMHFNLSQERYAADLARIKELIASGDTFQINYTGLLNFDYAGSPAELYNCLRQAQPVPYSAFMRCDSLDILSFSPELFFRLRQDRITCKPMKGTARRGRTVAEDEAVAAWLTTDPKSRAENVMIVDLMRNDLGRICRPGSISVPDLFGVERHPTLWQMTSSVEGRLRRDVSLPDIIKALFPCGSVTGAPKVRSMQIIADLERQARGIYTGTIGWISPQREGAFSVAIRTIGLDRRTGRGEMGIGSGIVWDSDTEDEYRECLLKGRFLTSAQPEFQLLETMLWEREVGFVLLSEHLQRLEASAGYFDFPFDRERIAAELAVAVEQCFSLRQRVRLLLAQDGSVSVISSALPGMTLAGTMSAVTLSDVTIDSNDIFLYHKTTNRGLFDREAEACRKRGYHETIFLNERGELTQGAISNLFLQLDGKLYTPPVECGLLPGVTRKRMLDDGTAAERVLYPGDLKTAEKVILTNAVRGCIEVRFE